jgi:hypothetical protein
MNKTYSSAFLAYYLRLLTWHALYSFWNNTDIWRRCPERSAQHFRPPECASCLCDEEKWEGFETDRKINNFHNTDVIARIFVHVSSCVAGVACLFFTNGSQPLRSCTLLFINRVA